MNYRHHYHAGNFADVVKHVLVVRLWRALQQKPKPVLYLDTHAGRGGYDLTAAATGDSLARTPEWPDGIGRLWGREDLPPAIAEYVALVRAYDRSHGNLQTAVRFYPGSPFLADALARPQDRLALCELHRGEFDALADAVSRRRGPGQAKISLHELDGYTAVRAMLPPAERRALVLIDPPYESQDEFIRIAAALEDGLKRFPSGVYAVWFPLTERARVQEFVTAIDRLAPPPTLAVELTVVPESSPRKLKGCGLLVVNPPWKFEVEARQIVDWLTPVLTQEGAGTGSVTWVVPER